MTQLVWVTEANEAKLDLSFLFIAFLNAVHIFVYMGL